MLIKIAKFLTCQPVTSCKLQSEAWRKLQLSKMETARIKMIISDLQNKDWFVTFPRLKGAGIFICVLIFVFYMRIDFCNCNDIMNV